MRTTWMMMTMLSVWALPVQAERIEDRPAIPKLDAPLLVMAVRLSDADRTGARDYAPVHSTHNEGRPALRKLGPVPRVHLTAEQIAEAVREGEAGASGDVLIVDCNGNFDHDTIQGAIDAASDGDVIMVLPNTCTEDGHYFENINFLGKAITLQSLLPENPAIVEATVVNGSGDDLSVVRFVSGEGPDSIFAGLTITGGSGTPVEFDPDDNPGFLFRYGGGIACVGSSPTVRSCRIIANQATFGGGLGGLNASPVISRCTFLENHTFVEVQTVNDVTFAVFADGGGLGFDGTGFPALSNCRIVENVSHAEHDLGDWPPEIGLGGGLAIWIAGEPPSAVISNCRISGNQVTGGPATPFDGAGGGIVVGRGQVSVINTMITGNSAPAGGAVAGNSDQMVTFLGGTIAANETVINCTPNCGAVRTDGTVRNGIIHGNVNGDLGSSPGPAVLYSNVDTSDGSTIPGEGNINADPLFVDPDNGDYHLAADSPCVEAGDPEFEPEEGETDIDGDPRIVGQRVDMGADEFLISCDGDFDLDGAVGAGDLALLLGSWGPCDDPDDCPADLDGDGAVGAFDLALLLGNWGPC